MPKALILVSTNPQYDDLLFIELRVQYNKNGSVRTCCIFCIDIQNNLCTQHVLSLEFQCTELVIQSFVILWVS